MKQVEDKRLKRPINNQTEYNINTAVKSNIQYRHNIT